MASNVQSIVCCLGDPVAGNPTQFLMQRAAAAQGLDWMFVTAEVPAARIEEAFQGIRALNFSGAAFLPPHRSAGVKLVDAMTESAMRSGQVRVARRDGDSWLGEDTLGASIVELLKSDDVIRTEGSVIGFHGRDYLPHLIRLAAPESWRSRLATFADQRDANRQSQENSGSIDEAKGQSSDQLANTDSTSASIGSLSAGSTDQSPIEAFVVDGSTTPPGSRTLAKLKWTASPTLILVEANAAWESALVGLKLSNLRIIRPVDIVAAKAVVNFQFWTGIQTDLAQMRDALDEYCQW